MKFFICLLILLFIQDFSHSQSIKWEADYTTAKSSSQIKFESDSNIGKTDEIETKASNDVVSKQYYPQQSPFASPPKYPSFQFQPQQPQYSIYPAEMINGDASPWDWSQGGQGQQSRKPSYVQVQFPGENPFSSSSTNSNSNRKSSTAVRIDEKCQCGVVAQEKASKNKLQRIVGGITSKENSWPWMVALVFMGQSKPFWFCGGSLVSNKFVLTAAHCLKTIRNLGTSNIKLIMGTNNLMDSKAAVYYSIRAVRHHPLYKSGIEDYDIALLETKETVNFTSKVSPICLKQEGHPFINRSVIVAGWGSLQNGEGPPADLREVDLKIVSNDLCEKEYLRNYQTSVTSSMMCAWLPGKDSCQGDSGGPLFMKTKNSSPYVYTQVGIVSFGPPSCGTSTIPGVYSRVASAIKWIKSIARNGKFCKGSF